LVEALDASDEPHSSPFRESLKKSNEKPGVFLTERLAHNLLLGSTTMKTGDSLKTTKVIRSQRTGFFYRDKGPSLGIFDNLDVN
jgi:hypothetical protein